MKKKIGAITIGQSPRIDVIPEMQEILGENVIILEAGALDGLTKEEIEEFKIARKNYKQKKKEIEVLQKQITKLYKQL